MAIRPKKSTILAAYSLEELLDLVKEKAQRDAQEKMAALQQRLESAMRAVDPQSRTHAATPPKKGRATSLQRVSKSPKTPKPRARRKRAKNAIPLTERILSILDSQPISAKDILAAVQQDGWITSSKNPRALLQLKLGKLIKKGRIKKAGRGMYAVKKVG